MPRRGKLLLTIISFAFSLSVMTFAVLSATSHTLDIKSNISFDIENNISFNIKATAYHGNYQNSTLSKITDYKDRNDKPTSFNNDNFLEVKITDNPNTIMNNGWTPFNRTNGKIKLEENSLIWEFILENTTTNNIKAEILPQANFWNEEVISASSYNFVTTYQIGNTLSNFDAESKSPLKTTVQKKFMKVVSRLTITNPNQNKPLESFNFNLRITEENIVINDISMLSFEETTNSASITAINPSQEVNTIIIPKTYKNKPITKIYPSKTANVLSNNNNVEEIVLPSTVKEINNSPTNATSGIFSNCKNLKSINLENVEKLSESAFNGCSKLNNITLNNNLKIIPNNCFKDCLELSLINLNNITLIGENAFRGCLKLNNINLDNIETINNQAFRDCSSLDNINFGNKSYKINQGAFYQCSSLKEIDLKNGIITNTHTFLNNTNLQKVILSPMQTALYDYTFYNCSNLKTVNIENICYFEIGCFNNCILLESFDGGKTTGNIKFNKNLKSIKEKSFNNCKKLKEIQLPKIANQIKLGQLAFASSGLINTLYLPNNYILEKYGMNSPFYNCELTNYKIDVSNNNYASDGKCLYTKSLASLIAYPIANKETNYNISQKLQYIVEGELERAKYLKTITLSPNNRYLKVLNHNEVRLIKDNKLLAKI